MWTIVQKEFLENLLNLRFLIGTLVAVLLTVGCIMLQAGDYTRRLEDYRFSLASQEEYNNDFDVSQSFQVTQTVTALIPPQALSPLANGVPPAGAAEEHFDENFIPQLYPVPDLVFIVSVILSLMAVLFSHDSICGERERGTLRLIQSNPLARPKLILAKWLGGSLGILLPLVLSCLAGMIYISLSPRLQLVIADWAGILLLLASSIGLISVFYLLGLMVSALSRSAATALIVAVLLWAVSVFLVPSLAPYLAARIEPVASLYEKLEKNTSKAQKQERAEIEGKMDDLKRDYERQYGQLFRDYQSLSGQEKSDLTRPDAPESPLKALGLKYSQEYEEKWHALWAANFAESDRLNERIAKEWDRQTRLSRNFAAVSPFADYVFLATDLAGTGIESRRYEARQTIAFTSVLEEYTISWIRKLNSTRREDWDQLEFDPKGWPNFEYKPQSLGQRVENVLPFAAALLFFNALFFTVAYVAFLRYDVR